MWRNSENVYTIHGKWITHNLCCYYIIITINIIKRNVLYILNKSTIKEILFYINNYIL